MTCAAALGGGGEIRRTASPSRRLQPVASRDRVAQRHTSDAKLNESVTRGILALVIVTVSARTAIFIVMQGWKAGTISPLFDLTKIPC